MIVLAEDDRLTSRPTVNVTRPKYNDVPKLARAFSDAFANCPMVHYVYNDPNPSVFVKTIGQLRICLHIILFKRTKMFLTVGGGVAGVIVTPLEHASRPHDTLATLLRLLLKVVKRKGAYEAGRRLKELNDKVGEAVKNTLGNRVKEMWYIDGLFTAPSSQGQGYGGALLDAVTSQADQTSHAVWLKSSNTANTAFYNLHGFNVVTEVVLGDQNPTWTGPPVIVSIMLREPGSNEGWINEKGMPVIGL